ncbi:glycosyltransferase family 4 protein [Pseudoclavibacter helvolus]|uniref:glycosyltransferase family 4 protein n=1 Tax=Pseudoclavibacter helvolus TaxID=255205 RepID=UPI003D15DAB7
MARILHVTECYAGGVRKAMDAITELAPQHEHHLLWAGDENPTPGRYTSVRSLPPGLVRRSLAVRRGAEALGPDVVHAHSSWAGVYARLLPISRPLIYQPHCYKFDDPTSPAPMRWFYRSAEALLVGRTQVTVVLSPHEEELAARISANHRHFLPNVASIDPDRVAVQRGTGRVVMLGRITSQKDPAYFVEVAQRVLRARPETKFVWIGDGDDVMRSKLLDAGIEITGWLDSQGVAEELANTDVYFHSAAYEGFPLSVLDAAALELPVVVRSIDAFDGTQLLRAESIDEASKQLVEILDGGALRERAVQGSRHLNALMSRDAQRIALDHLYSASSEA